MKFIYKISVVSIFAILICNSFFLSSQIPKANSNNYQSIQNQKSCNNSHSLITNGQIKGIRDESGNQLFSNYDLNYDSTESDAVSEKNLNGLNADDNFGISVTGAGDVNGDGYDDIIAGAPNNDYSAADGGRAFIYFGGVNFNSTPDVIFTGTSAGYYLGYCVSSAGDVNGDSYDDVIIGLHGYNGYQGRVYIYYGGASMNSSVDVVLSGEIAGDYFGQSVSCAGDVNGDGFSDVIVGAPVNTTNTGKAYIYFGGSSMNNTADVTMTGPAVNSSFGRSVSTAGDMNGDGYSDVIVGASGYSTNTGRTYVYFGGSAMDNTADLTMTGASTNYYFGFRASAAGDMNGDGYTDVVVGAYGYSSSKGRAYVYFGGVSPNSTADILLYGEATGDNFGIYVSSAGDFNSDGYGDIIIGASGFNSGTGKAYLYKGGEIPDDNADKYFNGEAASDAFGYCAASCGDINNDGNTDLIAGAYLSDINGSNSGRAYIYMNSMTGNDIPDLIFTGNANEDFLGFPAAYAGDVNGDGFDDIILGVSGYNGGLNQGRAYIYYGGSLMNNTADVTLTGGSASDFFGVSASYAGDVNGDGYADVIVGADGYNAGTRQGRAYIYFGGSSMNSTADVILTGISASDRFGSCVSDAGDVNGDGFGDVIVGAYGYNAGTNAGRAYIYLGGSSMNNVSDVTLSISYAGDYFGYSVSGTGDLNGDGFDDVVVGAYRYDGGTVLGTVIIFYGGSDMNQYPDLIITGGSEGDSFGYSVSEAGDVNADGYSDLLVGAIGYSSGSNQGRAYIYYGGFSMNTIADVIMTGNANNDGFGGCVSSAGDINGDGYDDVIAGAYGYPLGYSTGKTYIYFGGNPMNNAADIVSEGENISDTYGGWVSSAGDVNADGLGDIIIGAPNYPGGFDNGRAYLYFSTPPEVNPRIFSAEDVPFDQGGKVNLKWFRSGYDAPGQNLITSYRIEISDPPASGNFNWELTGSINASNNYTYQFTPNTPNDSMGGNSGVKYFRITAVTSEPDQFWRSNIVSAYSVDNLAPLPPENLIASSDYNSVYLSWNQNLEIDLHHYIIFRNGIEIQISADNFFDDMTVADDSSYSYQIAAADIHGNRSVLSDPVIVNYNNAGQLNLTLIMEGFYDAGLNNMRMSDTAKVYFKNSSSPFASIDSATGVIDSNTFQGIFKIINAPTGNYYIAVKHRNSIETWSSNAVAYTAMSTINYSFADAVTSAYGNNIQQVDYSPVKFGIYSGDVDKNGVIDGTDASIIDNDALNFVTGYEVSDITGDNVTDASDAAIADNNAANFVSAVVP